MNRWLDITHLNLWHSLGAFVNVLPLLHPNRHKKAALVGAVC